MQAVQTGCAAAHAIAAPAITQQAVDRRLLPRRLQQRAVADATPRAKQTHDVGHVRPRRMLLRGRTNQPTAVLHDAGIALTTLTIQFAWRSSEGKWRATGGISRVAAQVSRVAASWRSDMFAKAGSAYYQAPASPAKIRQPVLISAHQMFSSVDRLSRCRDVTARVRGLSGVASTMSGSFTSLSRASEALRGRR